MRPSRGIAVKVHALDDFSPLFQDDFRRALESVADQNIDARVPEIAVSIGIDALGVDDGIEHEAMLGSDVALRVRGRLPIDEFLGRQHLGIECRVGGIQQRVWNGVSNNDISEIIIILFDLVPFGRDEICVVLLRRDRYFNVSANNVRQFMARRHES